jgi:hypothetical protein
LNSPYQSKAPWGNLTGYVRTIIEVSTEEVMADARAAGVAVSNIDEFRSLTPQERIIINRLADYYVKQTAKWCAFGGATSGIGGALTAMMLGAADFIHIAGRLYRLCLRLAILNSLDPRDLTHREQIEEIYLSSLGFDPNKEFILRQFVGRSTARPGSLSASISYTTLIIAVGRKLWARRLTSRITGRFLPLFGAGVGAGSNYLFAKRAGSRMKDNFQRVGHYNQ